MNDNKILFIHIPKNAGNSIHRNLIDLNFNIVTFGHRRLLDIDEEIKKKYKILAVIRNPYDRLVSYYSFYKTYNKRFIDLKKELQKKYKTRIHNIDKKILIDHLKNMESLEWSEKFIKKNPRLINKILNKLNGINEENFNFNISFKDWLFNNLNKILSQHKYLEDNYKVDYLLRFENIEVDYQKFLDNYGIKNKLPRKNISNHKPYLEYYNDDIFNFVREFVKKDCEIYNYELK